MNITEHLRGYSQEICPIESIALSVVIASYLGKMDYDNTLDRLHILSPYHHHGDIVVTYITNGYPNLNNVETRVNRVLRNCVETVSSCEGLEQFLTLFTAGRGPMSNRPVRQDSLLYILR